MKVMREKKYLVRRVIVRSKQEIEEEFGLSIISFSKMEDGRLSDVRIEAFVKEIPGVETLDSIPVLVEDTDGFFTLLKR